MNRRPLVMGIVNVTPDSFFPDSRTATRDAALARGRALFAAGCDIVDVGGESTRPGAVTVAEDEELERVLPVVSALAHEGEVSIDTQKAAVARAAVGAGARIVNDVSCTLLELAGELSAGYVAMHRQGSAATMQSNPTYGDVVGEVCDYLGDAGRRARAAGVARLWLDPGIGFGKTLEHNLALLSNLERLVAVARGLDAGVLVGTSRKSFLGQLGAAPLDVGRRLEGSIASEAWALLAGADVVRVHDAAPAVALRELLSCDLAAVGS